MQDKVDKPDLYQLLFEEVYLFCVLTYLSTLNKNYSSKPFINKLNIDLRELIYKNICKLDAKSYINELLSVMMQFYQYNGVDINENEYEKSFYENSAFEKALDLMNLLTNGFECENSFKLNNLNSVLYLLSFLSMKQGCLHQTENLSLFYKFMKDYLMISYSIDFSDYFIIRNRLYGYLNLIHKKILNEDMIINQSNKYSYTIDDVVILENEIEQLKEPKHLYLISRILKMNNKINNKALKLRLKALFWNIFNNFELDNRIQTIKIIYENLEISDINWNKNIIQENFNQEFMVLINQLSADNVNNVEVSNDFFFKFQA